MRYITLGVGIGLVAGTVIFILLQKKDDGRPYNNVSKKDISHISSESNQTTTKTNKIEVNGNVGGNVTQNNT